MMGSGPPRARRSRASQPSGLCSRPITFKSVWLEFGTATWCSASKLAGSRKLLVVRPVIPPPAVTGRQPKKSTWASGDGDSGTVDIRNPPGASPGARPAAKMASTVVGATAGNIGIGAGLLRDETTTRSSSVALLSSRLMYFSAVLKRALARPSAILRLLPCGAGLCEDSPADDADVCRRSAGCATRSGDTPTLEVVKQTTVGSRSRCTAILERFTTGPAVCGLLCRL
mmetsp:Transcript_96666/g.221493  ORF Transcript_96666/g.221493 Transcript_96666/m.221493 type:complete len:228 (-) Transcript_96666:200-883(-)